MDVEFIFVLIYYNDVIFNNEDYFNLLLLKV